MGLILLYVAMWFNWQWIWGVLFLIWVIPDLFSGITYFIEPIQKKEHPTLYWVIVSTWVILSLYSFSTLFFPDLKYY